MIIVEVLESCPESVNRGLGRSVFQSKLLHVTQTVVGSLSPHPHLKTLDQQERAWINRNALYQKTQHFGQNTSRDWPVAHQDWDWGDLMRQFERFHTTTLSSGSFMFRVLKYFFKQKSTKSA